MRIASAAVLLIAGLSLLGCRAADPSVTLLNNNADPNLPPFVPGTGGLHGRVTLGSDAAPRASAGFILKGRVSAVAPASGASASGYALQGTVRF